MACSDRRIGRGMHAAAGRRGLLRRGRLAGRSVPMARAAAVTCRVITSCRGIVPRVTGVEASSSSTSSRAAAGSLGRRSLSLGSSAGLSLAASERQWRPSRRRLSATRRGIRRTSSQASVSACASANASMVVYRQSSAHAAGCTWWGRAEGALELLAAAGCAEHEAANFTSTARRGQQTQSRLCCGKSPRLRTLPTQRAAPWHHS